MPGQIGQPDRTGLADHQAQDAVPPRQWPDQRPLLVADTVGGEALEHAAVGRQHADCRVVRTDHLGRDLDDALQHPVQRQLGDEGRRGDDQVLEPRVGAEICAGR